MNTRSLCRCAMSGIFLFLWLLSQAATAATISLWTPMFKGVDYATATTTTSETPGPLNIHVMRISLNTPGVSLTSTSSSAATYPGFETFSQTTSDYVSGVGAKTGINANFFSVVSTTAQPENLFGLAMAGGLVISPPEESYPAFVITKNNAASIVTTSSTYDTSGLWTAVSGSSIILQNGAAISPPAGTSGDPYNPNPRSALGLSQDGAYLYMMVIDGRTTASVGCTQQQAGAFLAMFGAYSGLNLDGGGSSALVKYIGPGVVNALNSPSGGSQRLNGNNLAVFADALPVSAAPVLPYAQVIAAHNPVGYYHFNETTGTAVTDSSGNSRDGTFPTSGVTKGVADHPIRSEAGTSATFDGAANTHVNVPYTTALNPGSFSVEAWAKPMSATNAFGAVVGNRNDKGGGAAGNSGYVLYFGPATGDGGSARWQFWTGGITTQTYTALGRNNVTGFGLGPVAAVNTWSHVVGTFSASSGPDVNGRYTGTQCLYVNGTLALSLSNATYLPNNARPFYIGASNNELAPADGLRFIGGIDEVAVYNTALTAVQIQSHYQSGITTLSAPIISLTSPANGADYPFNTTINLVANAADTDGSVTKVEFFDGSNKLGEVTSAPFEFPWTGAAIGAHAISLKATDDSTLTATSEVTSIMVHGTVPTVSLTSPAGGASFTMPAAIPLTAVAADADGTISKVEFYAGATKLGEATAAPYTFAWNGGAAGVHALTAVATNDVGVSTVSDPVTISIATAAVSFSFTENFNSMGSSGTAPPSGWSVWQGASSPATTNATWASSIVASGAGSVPTMIAAGTPLTASSAPTANNNNGYNGQGTSSSDRVLASAPTTGAGTALQLSLTNTSGAALSGLTIGYDTRRYTVATSVNELPGYWLFYSLDNGATWTNASTLNPTITTVPNTVGVSNIPATAITLIAPWASNANLRLRWVDDNAQQSSPDQVIGLDNVIISASIPSNVPPLVALTSPVSAATFNAPAAITLTASASDIDGVISKVEFYNGATLLGQATLAPYSYSWNGVVTGTYSLTAKATDNNGVSTTSTPVSVAVTNATNSVPSVAITSPVAAASFTAPATITVTASASDTDGIINKVEFYNGATLLGQATTSPYSSTWTNVAAGNYSLTAKATDNDSGVTISAPVSLTVTSGGGAPSIGLTESFDTLGGSGTALPTGWSYYSLAGSHEDFVYAPPAAATFLPNSTSTAILVGPGTGSISAIPVLTVATSPAAQKGTSAYNLGLNATDRCVGTSPSGNAGGEIQWSVTNTTAGALNSFSIGYDIRRFTTTTNNNTAYDSSPYRGIEEIPGYWLFYSLDNGVTWTNVSALNPTISGSGGVLVPNSVGVTTVPSTPVSLNTPWASGATLLLRWFDDNAESPSPDQIIGLDNVSFAAGTAVGSPPIVALSTPAAGTTFTAPANIAFTATATDSDGTISKVEFYNGATLLGQSTASPYTFSWTNVSAGIYSLTARATDNDNNTTSSTAVSVTVNPSGGPTSGTLTRGPYLQKANPTAMTIRWRSSQSIIGRVRYGATAANLDNFADETVAGTEHEIRLTSLAAATAYFYSVGSANDTLLGDATTTFTTPPVAGTAAPTRVWVLGDAGTGSANQSAVRDAFYNWTGSRTPELVLQLGDNAYNSGTDSEFQSAMFNMYSAMLRKSPFWSCLGNHETAQSTSFVDTYPYFNIYSFPTAGECGGVASGTEHYFSWDYGNTHFISLDSMTASRASNGAMATWLTNDLASTTATWVICIFHHPPYTKGSHNSDSEAELVQMRQNILPILENGGVDLVLGGHSHCFERSYLLDGHYGLSSTLTANMKKNAGNGRIGGGGAYIKPLTGPRAHGGTVYCVAGSAGQISGGSLNHPAHFTSLNNLGSAVLDISGTRLDLTFLRENGSTPDTFTMIKQGGTLAPLATTLDATNITATGATLNASINPNGSATTAKIEIGTTTSYGADSSLTLTPNDGLDALAVSVTLNNLLPGTTYHFRVTSTNANGTVSGDNRSFTTPKLAQVITFDELPNKIFGDAEFDLTATGGSSSSPVLFTLVSGPAALTGHTLNLTGAGLVTVRASQAGDATYLAAPDVERSFTSAKAAQVIEFAALPGRTYGDPAFNLSASGGGSTSSVVFSLISGPAILDGASLTINGAGEVTVSASQAGDANHLTASNVERSFTVAKAAQALTFGMPSSKTYGDAPFDLRATAGASTAPVLFRIIEGAATLDGNTITLNAAGNVVVRASQAGDTNYLAAPDVQRAFNVVKAAQTIAFNSLPDKVFGDASFDLTASGGGSVSPVVFAVMSGPARVVDATVTMDGAGAVVIRASQAGDANHEAAPDVDRSFNVIKAGQGITFESISDKVFGTAPFDVTATGGGSTEPVVFTIFNGPATISGKRITITGAGSVLVSANQAGDANHEIATEVLRSFNVAKASEDLTFDVIADKTFGDAAFDITAHGGGSTAPVKFTVVNGPVTLIGNTVTITGTGDVMIRASQAGDDNHVASASVERTFTIAKAVQTLSFDPAVPDEALVFDTIALAATSDRGLTPITFSVVGGRGRIINGELSFTGPSNVTIRADQAGDDKYHAATVQKTVLATTGAPVITGHPAGQIGVIGKPVTFNVSATTLGAPAYQWRRNGNDISKAASASYTIPKASAAHVGVYTVEVKNSYGPVQSQGAELVLVDDISKDLSLSPGATATMSVATVGVSLRYQWSKDNAPLTNVEGHIAGATTAKLIIKPLIREDAGAYTCTVSKDGLGSRAGGVTTLVISTLKPELAQIGALPTGAVGKAYSYQVQLMEDQPGQDKTSVTKFSATGLPAGLKLDNTGLISGTPTAAVASKLISITATNRAGVGPPETCTMTIRALPESAVGTFVGRFERSPGVNANVGGRLDLTTTASGSFTAKLTQLGVSSGNTVSGKGVLVTLEAENGVLIPTGSVTLARSHKSPLTLNFSFNDSTNELSGGLTDPDNSAVTALTGVRNVWSATHLAASYSGYYTLALELSGSTSSTEVTAVPQGNGFASFTVADKGTLTWTGKTADGVANTAATVVGPAGQLVLFAPLVTTGGSLTGTPVITTAVPSDDDGANPLSGELLWSKAKPASASDRTYKSGFDPIPLTVIGGKYTPPKAGEVVMSLPNVDKNARLSFASGGLLAGEMPPLTFDIRNLSAKGVSQKVKLPPAGPEGNPGRITFVLASAPKGQFSGNFVIKTPRAGASMISRSANYSGMIISHGDTFTGYGHFLLPQLPGIGEKANAAPIWSGQVILEKAPESAAP